MAAVLAGLVLLALVAGWLGLAWHGLVAARNRAEATWGAIDARLTERHRVIPVLEEAIAAVAPEEAEVLGRLHRARAAALAAVTPFEQADAERHLMSALDATAALVQRHPLLGGSRAFVDAQAQLAAIEDRLQAARRLYNADVRLYLRRRRRLPSVLVGLLADFPERPYFELDHTRERRGALRLVG